METPKTHPHFLVRALGKTDDVTRRMGFDGEYSPRLAAVRIGEISAALLIGGLIFGEMTGHPLNKLFNQSTIAASAQEQTPTPVTASLETVNFVVSTP